MLTSKQRAYLRGLGNNIETIFQIGKGGVNENLINQVRDALNARELIKLRVLDNNLLSSREVADEIADRVAADVVQVIGTKFILFKISDEKANRKIDLKKI